MRIAVPRSGLLAFLGLASCAAASAAEIPGLRVSTDPALPVAGRPLRVTVDFSETADASGLLWERDESSGAPSQQVENGALVLWVVGFDPDPPIPAPPGPPPVVFDVPGDWVPPGYLPIQVRRRSGPLLHETLARAGVVVQAESPTLALQAGRFRLSITYVDPRDGQTHAAAGVRASEESGNFWFFDPRNPEVFVKLLDGEGINGHYWLFASSLTTLEYTLEILDAAGGCLDLPVTPPACPVRRYHHPAGPSRNLEDVEAMPAARPGPEPPVAFVSEVALALDPALPHRGDRLRVHSNLGIDFAWCYVEQGGVTVSEPHQTVYLNLIDHSLPITPIPCGVRPPELRPYVWEIDTFELPTPWTNWRVAVVYEGYPPIPEAAIGTTGFELRDGTAPFLPAHLLLLHPERPPEEQFVARVEWTLPATQTTRSAKPTVLSSDAGVFTFFGAGNLEVTVKLLDGRSVNGHWWLFAASQTRLPFTLTIVRGFDCARAEEPGPECEVYTFTHPEGPPQNRIDLEAFAAGAP